MFKVACLALLLIGAAFAADSDVVVLTEANFDSVVSSEEIIMVEFYAPWCGHCKALAPKYEKAATELKGTAKLAKVDCTVESNVCSKYEVRGYPTVKIFRKGAEPTDYQGAREVDAIVGTIRKAVLPAVSTLTEDKVEEFSNSDRVVVISFLEEADAAKFTTLANTLRENFVFGAAPASAASKFGATAPAVILFKKFDERKNIFTGPFEVEAMTEFVNVNSVPIMDDVGPQNYGNYVKSGLPLAFLFIASEDDKKTIGAEVEAVAKDYKGKINFVYIDGTKYGGFAENLNLKQQWPAFAIQIPNKGHKYAFSQSETVTGEAVRTFCQGFVDGTIQPSLKSEEIPEQTGPVTVVVGKSYNDIVNAEKDVLIEFYAPWCGHCKKLAPIYDELAEKLAAYKDKIVIAKMDATANDLPLDAPFQIEGFPTIKLVKADNTVVDYNGSRTVGDFVEFLQTNAVNGGAIEVSADEDDHDDDHDHDHDEL